jgi:hypothetical protein
VIRVLERLRQERGLPEEITCDNELNASRFLQKDDSIPLDHLNR